jgi:hypothetical protein
MQAQSIVKDATTRKDRMLSSGTGSKSNNLINHPINYKALRRKRKKTRSYRPSKGQKKSACLHCDVNRVKGLAYLVYMMRPRLNECGHTEETALVERT